MKPERWQKLDELFHSALALDGEARTTFLAKACDKDAELLRELESLLAHHHEAKSFIELPAYGVEAKAILNNVASQTLTGKTVGSYQVLNQLGRGGMGEVYLAYDKELRRNVALKFLHAEFSEDKQRLRRFKSEARAASALNHPNILTVFEIGETEDHQFIATEFVEGRTLREVMKAGQINLWQVFDIAIQIASALSAAHGAGIIHRDIKPENIMLRPDGYIKIVDFGVAKLTDEHGGDERGSTALKTEIGTAVGTITYMSPEQIRALDVDVRTDIWSFGVLLYEMIVGSSPFKGETSGDIIANILKSEPTLIFHGRVKTPPELGNLIVKGLAKDRTKRYQTMEELLVDLRKVKSQLESPGDLRTVKQRAKRALGVIAFGAVLVLLIVIGVKLTWRTDQTSANLSSVNPIPTVTAERTLAYALNVQKMRNQKPYELPFQSYGEDSFQNGWKFRLVFSSPESGFLYLLSENVMRSDLSILYPETSVGDALIQPNQIRETDWYVFDQDSGTEKLWVIWSANMVPELEKVRRFLNIKDRGLISASSASADARAIRDFLAAHSLTKPQIKRDTEKRLIIAKAKGEVLTSSLELVHH